MTQHSIKPVLVVGATGTVGGAAVRALQAQGARVRVLLRPHTDARALGNVEVVRGCLQEGEAVARAIHGVSAALYVSPHDPDEEAIGTRFVAACEAAAVRLVFVGVHVDGSTRFGRAARRLLFGRLLPHYRPKFRVAELARQARNSIVLMPTNFFQNDELFDEELRAGRFVQPFERPINRVDVRDVGEAAARACLDEALKPGAYPVMGPCSLDANMCASSWSAALGFPVSYEPAEGQGAPSGFEAAMQRSLAGKKREDFRATYAAIRKFKMATRAEDVARTAALLGRQPKDYATYVAETVARWRGAGEGGKPVDRAGGALNV